MQRTAALVCSLTPLLPHPAAVSWQTLSMFSASDLASDQCFAALVPMVTVTAPNSIELWTLELSVKGTL